MPDVHVVLLLTQEALGAGVVRGTLAGIGPHTATTVSTGQLTHRCQRDVERYVIYWNHESFLSKSLRKSALFYALQHVSPVSAACTDVRPRSLAFKGAGVPVWQPAPVQPGGHRHLFQRIQVPPWAQGGEHIAEIHNRDFVTKHNIITVF